jgi:hypothetical protein
MTTKAEQETTLRWAADEDVVSIFTAHPPTRRKAGARRSPALPHEHGPW